MKKLCSSLPFLVPKKRPKNSDELTMLWEGMIPEEATLT
jgi:hypothetical protein